MRKQGKIIYSMINDLTAIGIIVMITLVFIFVIRMLINLFQNDLSLMAKIIWFIVIVSLIPLGAILYFITEKEAKL